MGRWDSDEDDWRGWKDGKYDNRYGGRRNYNRNYRQNKSKTKSVTVGIVFLLIIGVFGFILFDQGYLDKSIQTMPESIQDVSQTAKEITTETTEKLSKTVNEQLENIPFKSVDTVLDKIPENPVESIIPKIDEFELEKQIHQLTNKYRLQNNLHSLSFDEKLSKVARNHSQDMAVRDYFAHDTPEGKDPTSRATSQGYQCEKRVGNLIYSGVAENIFQNNLYDSVTIIGVVPIYDWNSQEDIAQSTVDGWMDSLGHRQNILTSTYDREGIGVAISDMKVYITQDFC